MSLLQPQALPSAVGFTQHGPGHSQLWGLVHTWMSEGLLTPSRGPGLPPSLDRQGLSPPGSSSFEKGRFGVPGQHLPNLYSEWKWEKLAQLSGAGQGR